MKTFIFLKPVLLALLLSTMSFTASAYDFMVDGIAYNINSDGTSVTVTYTGYYSNNYSGLKAANIPSSVTYNGITYSVISIGLDAFKDCNDLTSISIPNTIISIGGNAFQNCSGLTSIDIPNSVTSIGSSAFSLCRSLTNVKLSETLTSISENTFNNCDSLTNIKIPNSVTAIYKKAFFGSGLTSIELGNSVTTIGESAFWCCFGLTSIDIPNSVTTIGKEVFYMCNHLTSVTLGENVHIIGQNAFNAENIQKVICKRFRPAAVDGDGNIFNSTVYNNAILYVPKGSLSSYYAAPDWMKFLNIQELDEGGQTPLKGDVNGDGKVNVSDVTALVNIILGVI